MKDQKGPVSPYLGISKEEEAATMRKILRYWWEKGIDPGVEHAWGMRGERCVGLTPYVADSRHQYDLPDTLMTTSPYHAGIDSVNLPADFLKRFCLETVPYYHRNHPDANYDYGPIHDPTDLCMPALWCEEPTLIAYSQGGFSNMRWPLPPEWSDVTEVDISRLTVEGPEHRETMAVSDSEIFLTLAANEAVCITQKG